jgi:hypothetical protein
VNRGKRSGFSFELYSIVKVLCDFQLYHPTKGTIVISEEAIASSPPFLRKRGLFLAQQKSPLTGALNEVITVETI